jgi:hypothetical protein
MDFHTFLYYQRFIFTLLNFFFFAQHFSLNSKRSVQETRYCKVNFQGLLVEQNSFNEVLRKRAWTKFWKTYKQLKEK